MNRERPLRGLTGWRAAACAAVLLAAAACGSGGGQGSEKIQLTYAMWDTPEQPGYQKSINAFEKAHPNINVTIRTTDYNHYESKLTTQFSSGDGPDVFWVNTPFLASWIKDGVLLDLTSKIRAAGIDMSQYLPSLVSLHTYNGKIYGLPKDWDTIAYYYNVEYFKKHHIAIPSSLAWNPTDGGTWLRFLRELTVDTAGNNATSPDFNPSSVATYATTVPNQMQWGYEPYLAENGVHIIGQPNAKTVAFGTQAATQTFQFLTDLMYKHHVAAPGSALGANAAADNAEDQQLFAKGKVAMIEGGDWETSAVKSEVKFPLGVLESPAGPRGKSTVVNGLIDAINAHGEHQQAAWQLERWLGSAASQRILGAGGYLWPGIPSLDHLYSDYWKRQGVDVRPFLTESTWQNVTWPVTRGIGQANLDMTNQLAPAYLHGGAVSTAVGNAAARANADLATAG